LNISLRSNDQHLRASFKTLIDDLRPSSTLLNPDSRPSQGQEPELQFWDYDSEPQSGLIGWKPEAPVIFLVRRQNLTHLLEELKGSPASILLKPVDSTVLKTAVELRLQAAANGPGNQQRDLLQYLLLANLKLQEFDQDRTNFLARAVHDLRSPLTALHGYCGLLVEQRLGPLTAAQTELLERMQQSVKRVSRMASAMFELSVGKQIERKPHLAPVDVEQCVQRALQDVLPQADEKQIALSVQIDRPEVQPRWEAAQIEQVLVNLVENACRFTPRFGSIEIKGYPVTDESGFRIDVRDSGTGIEAQHLPLIFEEYTSYSGSRDRSCGGLGLAICKMIVVGHGGRIWAESSAEGAVFSFILPLHDRIFHGNTAISDAKQLTATAAG
jgi:signal transduction histidine kinase